MIIEEIIENGERVYHYSDKGFKLRQIETNIIYEDVIDVIPCRYTYEETDELIENETQNAEQLLGVLLGEDVIA